MYDEDSFKSQIFWIKVKRIFLIIFFAIVGSALGVVISSYLIDVLLFNVNLRAIIVVVSTLIFVLISLLITANTGKEVQDGYWKIAVLRKLTLISKKLDNLDYLEDLENLESLNDLLVSLNSNIPKTLNLDTVSSSEETKSINIDNSENTEDAETVEAED